MSEDMATRDHFLDDGIIQAAYSEFLAYGFQKASLHKIAEKAGVTTGAIYTRYKSKVQRMNGFFSSFFNFFIPVHLFHDLHAKVAAVIAASQLSRSPSFYTRSRSTGRRRRECTAAQSQSRLPILRILSEQSKRFLLGAEQRVPLREKRGKHFGLPLTQS